MNRGATFVSATAALLLPQAAVGQFHPARFPQDCRARAADVALAGENMALSDIDRKYRTIAEKAPLQREARAYWRTTRQPQLIEECQAHFAANPSSAWVPPAK